MSQNMRKTVSERDDKTEACSAPEHSKSKLLKAAFEVFSKLGFHGATTKQISQTAQVNEALIMRHFKSKEGLFLAVIQEHLAGDTSDLTYPPQATLEDELAQFCEHLFNRDRSKSDFMRITISHSLQDQAFAQRAGCQVMNKCESHLIPRLKKFQENGQLPKHHDPELVEVIMINQAFATMFFNSLVNLNCEEESRKALRLAARAFARGLQNL